MPVLQFKGKSVIETYHHTVPHCRLEFDAKLSCLAKGQKPSLDDNLIIEGDNLLALKALLPTHAGRIKCVYIDPPYNTGNEGWIYNDNLTSPQFKEWIGREVGKEGEDACRHDKWCCMMYPRLVLLRELLREDGIIFVSIDDNEVHHLRMIMDELFGIDNFVACIAWQKVFAPKPAAKTFSTSIEYLLAFAKNLPRWDRVLLPRTREQDDRYANPDNDPRGPWASDNLLRNEHRDNSVYTVTSPSGKDWTPEPGTSWRHPESEMLEMIERNEIWFGSDGNNMPRRKKFLADVQQGLVPETLWQYDEVGHTQDAKRLVTQILGASTRYFPFPKPVGLIKRVIQISTRADDIVLDCTAGTGTTAHAVLEVNSSEGGSRRFILIQQAHDTKENREESLNICKDIARERVLRAIRGYSFSRKNGKGRTSKVSIVGLGGTFSYVRVGDPLFGEYKEWGKRPPPFADLARYVFYTETSRDCDEKQFDAASGFIGSTEAGGGTSYYLLYTPDEQESRELSLATLKALAKRDKRRNWVIYCEKFWMHPDQLRKFEVENGKRIRPMLVPFQLK